MKKITYLLLLLPFALRGMEFAPKNEYDFLTKDGKTITFKKTICQKCTTLKNCIDNEQTVESSDEKSIARLPFSFNTLSQLRNLINHASNKRNNNNINELFEYSLPDFIELFKAVTYLDCSVVRPFIMNKLVKNCVELLPETYINLKLANEIGIPESDVGINEICLLLKEETDSIKNLQKHIKPNEISLTVSATFLNTSITGSTYPVYDNEIDGYGIIDIESKARKHTVYTIPKDRVLQIHTFNDVHVVISHNTETNQYKITMHQPNANPIIIRSASKIHSVNLSPDKNSLLIGCGGGSMFEYNLKTRKPILINTNARFVFLVQYSPCGTHFVGVSEGKVKIWDTPTKKCLAELVTKPYNQLTLGKTVSFSAHNEVAYIGLDDTIHIIDLNSITEKVPNEIVISMPELSESTALCFSSDGNYLAVQKGESEVILIDRVAKQIAYRFANFAKELKIGGIFFSEDDSQIKLYDAHHQKMYCFPLCISKSYIASLTNEQLLLLTHIADQYATNEDAVVLPQLALSKVPNSLAAALTKSNIIRTVSWKELTVSWMARLKNKIGSILE